MFPRKLVLLKIKKKLKIFLRKLVPAKINSLKVLSKYGNSKKKCEKKKSLSRMKSVENLHRVAIPLGKYAGSLNIIKLKNFKTLKSLNNKFAA